MCVCERERERVREREKYCWRGGGGGGKDIIGTNCALGSGTGYRKKERAREGGQTIVLDWHWGLWVSFGISGGPPRESPFFFRIKLDITTTTT